MKLSKANKLVKAVLAATFPEYKGRKVSAERLTRYYVDNQWGGGTRHEVRALDLRTWRTADALPTFGAYVEIPRYVALVEHTIFQGHDCGIRIYVADNEEMDMIVGGAHAFPFADVTKLAPVA